MVTCELCPVGSPDVPAGEMADHLRTVHHRANPDGAFESDGDTIVRDASDDASAGLDPGQSEWHN